jgi:parallel beta-helix repeat protein
LAFFLKLSQLWQKYLFFRNEHIYIKKTLKPCEHLELETARGAGDDGVSGGGIWIEQFADANTTHNYCTIQNATSGVYVNAKVTISNCTIKDNRQYGIIIDQNADQSLTTDNSCSGNGDGETHIVEP